jgi:acetylornithine deacetylase
VARAAHPLIVTPEEAMSNIAALLADLIALPTHQASDAKGPGDELALCRHLAPLLSARGADAVEVVTAPRSDGSPGAYVFARWGTPRRIINAHVDTVPANHGWTRDPWRATIEGDRLYGLGSADTKGAIAATLSALDRARPRDFGVLFSGDEEAGSAVMHAFLASPHARDIRQAIVCEPSARAAGVAHRGILASRATFVGEGGHSSRADALPRPIPTLARLAVALDDLGRARLADAPAAYPEMRGTCLNVATLTGGVAYNVVPARAELGWSLRPAPGFDRAAWDQDVARAIAAIAPTGASLTLTHDLDAPPFACRDQAAMTALVAGHVTRHVALDYWTEAALFTAAGIDAIVIGPGDIAHAHAADEWVAIEDLAWAADLYTAIINAA